jgi:hypothetical protein
MVAEVFKTFEARKVKGQKMKVTKAKGKSKPTEVMEAHADMKMTILRYMQPLKDANVVTSVLQRVVNGELSLQEMGLEFKRIKVMMVVQRAFFNYLGDACKTKYPLHCTDELLINFVITFQNWVSQYYDNEPG